MRKNVHCHPVEYAWSDGFEYHGSVQLLFSPCPIQMEIWPKNRRYLVHTLVLMYFPLKTVSQPISKIRDPVHLKRSTTKRWKSPFPLSWGCCPWEEWWAEETCLGVSDVFVGGRKVLSTNSFPFLTLHTASLRSALTRRAGPSRGPREATQDTKASKTTMTFETSQSLTVLPN